MVTPSVFLYYSSKPVGYVEDNTDCNDNETTINPRTVWYPDVDGDGFGSKLVSVTGCVPPTTSSHVTNTSDFDDGTVNITNIPPKNYYQDLDNDTYGNPSVFLYYSNKPVGYVEDNTDCNDNEITINPRTKWYPDVDGDGFGSMVVSVTQCVAPASRHVTNTSDFDDGTVNITNIPPKNYYQDLDNDTYGNPSVFLYYSEKPAGYVEDNTDCNDNETTINPRTVWYPDVDGDGFGSKTVSVTGCVPPTSSNHVTNTSDFDDGTVNITNISPKNYYQDLDNDTYGNPSVFLYYSEKPAGYVEDNTDCNDNERTINPRTVWYPDVDGDGFGSMVVSVTQCVAPVSRHVTNTSDFDDGTVNITNIPPKNYYQDLDNDTYGNPSVFLYYSEKPVGYVEDNTDCNDNETTINPRTVWYPDVDGDGFGSKTVSVTQCVAPASRHVTNTSDFDDGTVNITNIPPKNYYQDLDKDGYGNPSVFLYYSEKPAGYVINNLDCNDNDKKVNPQKKWYLDGDNDGLGDSNAFITSCVTPTGYVDNNGDLSDRSKYITNLATTTFYYDNDKDGYGDPLNPGYYSILPPMYSILSGDCNDNERTINPDTVWYADVDGDGFGSKTISVTQCIAPTSSHVTNTSDFDDGTVNITNIPPKNYYQDLDNDGYGNPSVFLYYSNKPVGYVPDNTDCNDNEITINPNTTWYADVDGDGFGSMVVSVTQCVAPASRHVTNTSDFDDGTVNITNIPPKNYYQDLDNDTYGNPSVFLYYSEKPAGYVEDNTDCNDNEITINPRTVWYPDVDGDGFGSMVVSVTGCVPPTSSRHVTNTSDFDDGTVNITNIPPKNYYQDLDNDTYGNPSVFLYYSEKPAGYVEDNTDCNDNERTINPRTVWHPDVDSDGFGSMVVSVTGCVPPTSSSHVTNTSDFDDGTVNITNIPPKNYYQDLDNDTYGNPSVFLYYSEKPAGYVEDNTDCNDNETTINPRTVWYPDVDGDGFGSKLVSVTGCVPPTTSSHVTNTSDFDDGTVNITNIPPKNYYQDLDNDTYGNPSVFLYYSNKPVGYVEDNTDCNDNEITINPRTKWYPDVDGDGFGSKTVSVTQCVAPASRHVTNTSDFNDGTTDITNIRPRVFYEDLDSDGYGNPNVSLYYSNKPAGYVEDGTDCNDNEATINPRTIWYPDLDGDGFGSKVVSVIGCIPPTSMHVTNTSDFDDGTDKITNKPPQNFYEDLDGDGYGNPSVSLFQSNLPIGHVYNKDDCNDLDTKINPLTRWFLDSDNDGYGILEKYKDQCTQPASHTLKLLDRDDSNEYITNIAPQLFFYDGDGDGYGTPSNSVNYSIAPPKYVVLGGDCDDTNPLVHPNTFWYADRDGDGYGSSVSIKGCTAPPGFVNNREDFDDGTTDITNIKPSVFYEDRDGDGYGNPESSILASYKTVGYVVDGTDCNDRNDRIHIYTKWYLDEDGDGFGVTETFLTQCTRPSEKYSLNFGDCNDDDPTILPGALAQLVNPENTLGDDLTDCNSAGNPSSDEGPIIKAPTTEEQKEENPTGIIYADRDGDGFGDLEESFPLDKSVELNFPWSNNGDDACPKKKGLPEFKGCPEPLSVRMPQTVNSYYQVVRIFERDTLKTKEEIIKEFAHISDQDINNISVFPNPTKGKVTAKWDVNVDDFVSSIRVYGYESPVNLTMAWDGDSTSATIDISNESNGLYFVQYIFKDGRAVTRKIRKE